MKKIIIPIKGMHCKSCELLIEENLSKIPNVHKADAIYKKGILEVYYYNHKVPSIKQIEEAVRNAGYDIGLNEKKGLISKSPRDYKNLGIAFLSLLGLYFILKNFGLANFNFGATAANPIGFSIVFLIGLTAGASTCMALVGGLVLGLSARHAERHSEATPMQKFRPHLYFNLGRILGFAFLGGLLGSLGSIFKFSSLILGIITITVSLAMIVIGLQLTEIFPFINKIKLTLPKFVSQKMGIKNQEGQYNHLKSIVLGASTFFLPCGFTQAMQLYAVSTGNFLPGALVMGIFALGTVPGLLGIGGLTSLVKGVFAKKFFKFAGFLVIFFALFNISNGYNLTGWQLISNSDKEKISTASETNVKLPDRKQIVKMTQINNGYNPNKFTVRKGIPVKWIITSNDPFSCAASILMPKYNISKKLISGDNIIEFTPTEIGTAKFTCSMGMYSGMFNVIDNNRVYE